MIGRNRRWRREVPRCGLREHVCFGENIKTLRARSEESSQYRRKMSVPGSGCDRPCLSGRCLPILSSKWWKVIDQRTWGGKWYVWKWLFLREIILELNGLWLRNSLIWVRRLLSCVCSFRMCSLYPRSPLHYLGTREKFELQTACVLTVLAGGSVAAELGKHCGLGKGCVDCRRAWPWAYPRGAWAVMA